MAFLFRPKWKSKNLKTRRRALKRTNDSVILATIAKEDENWCMRKDAVAKLTNQNELKEIALKDEIIAVRLAATEKVDDQNVLNLISRLDSDASIREAATRRLSSQNVIAEVALTDINERVRIAAILILNDQMILSEIVKKDRSRLAQNAAESKLTGDNRSALSPWIDSNATLKIEDESVLTEIAATAGRREVARAAAEKVREQAFLSRLVMSNCGDEVRGIAIGKLTDESMLREILHGSNMSASGDASRRLNHLKSISMWKGRMRGLSLHERKEEYSPDPNSADWTALRTLSLDGGANHLAETLRYVEPSKVVCDENGIQYELGAQGTWHLEGRLWRVSENEWQVSEDYTSD